MRQTSFSDMHCSLARSLELIGDWWSPLILRDLMFGPRRFDEFADDLGISRTLLTTRLRELVAAGVVDRRQDADQPSRHHYQLTTSGTELVPILMSLMNWGDRWTNPPGGPPLMFQHRDCGKVFKPVITCSLCGEAVDAESVSFLAGQGARNRTGTLLQRDFIAKSHTASPSTRGR